MSSHKPGDDRIGQVFSFRFYQLTVAGFAQTLVHIIDLVSSSWKSKNSQRFGCLYGRFGKAHIYSCTY